MADLGRIYVTAEVLRECAETRAANDDAARIDSKAALRDDMMRTIGHAPRELIGDGKFHRFSTKSNARGDAGYYRFHDDEYPYAIYGDYRSGQRVTWSAREPAVMDTAEREGLDRVKAERERQARARRANGSERAKARWDRAQPASQDHPYIVRKGIQPHGVRQEGGTLLVPMFSDDGFSVQAIRADGTKRFQLGAPANGLFEINGSGDTIIIAEGFATAATVAEATGRTVIAAFSAHNLEAAARAVRETNPVAKIIIAADDDRKTELETGRNPGLRAAEKAADDVGATVVAPPFDREKDGDEPSDWNDFANIYGAGDVAPAFRWVNDGGHAGRSSNPLAGWKFQAEAERGAPPAMLVKHMVPIDGICFIGGQSGAGKTFIVCDLAVSLASGSPFFGHKVRERVGVAILAAEGEGTIENRIIVACDHKADGEILPIAWLGAVPNLADKKEVDSLIVRLRAIDAKFRDEYGVRLGAVICDTLAASFDLNDENDNSEAAKAIRTMKEMGSAVGAVVIPVHHYGKAADTGLRGASGWRAGCDAIISVLANRDQVTGECSDRRIALAKSRVGEEGWTAPFTLCFVALGEDEDGDEYGACFVEAGRTEDAIITVRKKKLPRDTQAYLDALGVILGDKGQKVRPYGSDGPEVVAVDREDIRAEFYSARPADGPDEKKIAVARRQAFKRGEDNASELRLITTRLVGGKTLAWLVGGEKNNKATHE